MDGLCEDLLLLALGAGNGSLGRSYLIGYVLMAAQLVQLAADGRLDVTSERILVIDPAPAGDPELDAALAGIAGLEGPPRPADWVARPPARMLTGYFGRLTAAGVIRPRHRWRFSTRWRITDGSRLASARGRLDAIAGSAGPVDAGQAAYAALVHAAGLDRRLYAGRARRPARQRLREIADGSWAAGPGSGTGPGWAAGLTAADAAAGATMQVAIQAAVHATVEAAALATVRAIGASAATG